MSLLKLKALDSFPSKRDFTAIWFVEYMGKETMFCAALYYNQEEDQYYTYDNTGDIFLPQCDHGFDEVFFYRVNASYFVKCQEE